MTVGRFGLEPVDQPLAFGERAPRLLDGPARVVLGLRKLIESRALGAQIGLESIDGVFSRTQIAFQFACALETDTQLFAQGGDGLDLIRRVDFEHLRASTRLRKTRTLFIVLGLQGSRRGDARIAVAHHASELDLESRDALALLRNRGFHRVSQLARGESCGFLLGEARVDSGERRFERSQILALHVRLGERARKIAFALSESLTLRELRGLEGCDARVPLGNVCGERDDVVVQESGVTFYLADLLVAPRQRSTQVGHLFVEADDARVALAQLRLQVGNFLRAAAEFALQLAQAHFAACAASTARSRAASLASSAPSRACRARAAASLSSIASRRSSLRASASVSAARTSASSFKSAPARSSVAIRALREEASSCSSSVSRSPLRVRRSSTSFNDVDSARRLSSS